MKLKICYYVKLDRSQNSLIESLIKILMTIYIALPMALYSYILFIMLKNFIHKCTIVLNTQMISLHCTVFLVTSITPIFQSLHKLCDSHATCFACKDLTVFW